MVRAKSVASLSLIFLVAVTIFISGCGGKVTVTEPAADKPVLSSLQPVAGAAGSQVKATGSGFGETQGVGLLRFGDEAAEVTSWSDKEIVFNVPRIGEGVHTVVVLTEDGASGTLQYTVTTETQPEAEDAAVTVFKASFGDNTGWTFKVLKVSSIDPNWKIVSAVKAGTQGVLGLMHTENGAWVVKASGSSWDIDEFGAPADMISEQ